MTRYDAYILRFWRGTGDGGIQCRFKMDHLGHNETREFDDLETLLRHLCTVAGMEDWRLIVEKTQLKGTEP